MAQTKQLKAANVLDNGFTSFFPGGDGVALLQLTTQQSLELC